MRVWLTHHKWIVRQSWPKNGQSFFAAGRQRRACRLGVGHSTETTGFPGYGGGAAAPHFTIDLPSGEVRQHIPLEYGSRCLAVSTAGVTNRTVNIDGVVQVEVIGAVTPGYPERYGHYDLVKRFPTDKVAQFHLARLLKAIHDETRIPLQVSSYAEFVPYPASYGVRAAQRLTDAEFADARGWIGHQNAPANDHGDGLYGRAVNGVPIDFVAVLKLAATIDLGQQVEPDYPAGPSPENNFGFPAEHIRIVQGWVNDLALVGVIDLAEPLVPDGVLHGKTMTAVRDLQAALGFPREHQDGLPGPKTTTATEALIIMLAAKLDKILEGQALILAAVEGVPEDTRLAVRQDESMGFSADWWRRGGLVTDPDHRAFPADPGSPADKVLRAEAAANDGVASVYTPKGVVRVRLDAATDRFVKVGEQA